MGIFTRLGQLFLKRIFVTAVILTNSFEWYNKVRK